MVRLGTGKKMKADAAFGPGRKGPGKSGRPHLWKMMPVPLALAAVMMSAALIFPSVPAAHSLDREGEAVLLVAQSAGAPSPGAPLEEQYRDWTLSCESGDFVSTCSVHQQLYHSQTRQRMLAIELRREASGISGVIVVPFGLRVDRTITILVDSNAEQYEVAVRTCLPSGCIIPVSFPESFAAQLKRGSALGLNATADNDEPVGLRFSLYGFSAATARLEEIAEGTS